MFCIFLRKLIAKKKRKIFKVESELFLERPKKSFKAKKKLTLKNLSYMLQNCKAGLNKHEIS